MPDDPTEVETQTPAELEATAKQNALLKEANGKAVATVRNFRDISSRIDAVSVWNLRAARREVKHAKRNAPNYRVQYNEGLEAYAEQMLHSRTFGNPFFGANASAVAHAVVAPVRDLTHITEAYKGIAESTSRLEAITFGVFALYISLVPAAWAVLKLAGHTFEFLWRHLVWTN